MQLTFTPSDANSCIATVPVPIGQGELTIAGVFDGAAASIDWSEDGGSSWTHWRDLSGPGVVTFGADVPGVLRVTVNSATSTTAITASL